MAPVDVNEDTLMQVWSNLYGNTKRNGVGNAFRVGDYVRVSKYKHRLEKGYLPKWTGEIFKVTKVIGSNPITYQLADWNNESIEGIFYSSELQRVHVPANRVFLIEKVLRRRGSMLYV